MSQAVVSSAQQTLKARQLSAVSSMLTYNPAAAKSASSAASSFLPSSASASAPSSLTWKVLIYDEACRDVISPLLSVAGLRSLGVTLHLLITAPRDPLPDVEALYFVRPTAANVQLLLADAAANKYSRGMHVNFCGKTPRPLLESLAAGAVQQGSHLAFKSVHDRHLDYVCPCSSLFTLNLPSVYAVVSSPRSAEADVMQAADRVAAGLFAVLSTMMSSAPTSAHPAARPALPVLRAKAGGPGESVARALHRLLSEASFDDGGGVPGSSLGGPQSAPRPVLLLYDRDEDITPLLLHPEAYQPLVADLLPFKGGRVSLPPYPAAAPASTPAAKPPSHDLDADSDPFFKTFRFRRFPEVVEGHSKDLARVRAEEDGVRSAASATGTSLLPPPPLAAGGSAAPGSGSLKSLVDSLPALLERKRQLEVHTAVLQALLARIGARGIPALCELETSVTTSGTALYAHGHGGATGEAKRREASEAIKGVPQKDGGGQPTLDDRLRLMAIWALHAPTTTESSASADSAQQDHALEAFKALKAEVEATPADSSARRRLKAVDRARALRSQAAMASGSFTPSSSAGDGGGGLLAGAASQATGLLAAATSRVGAMVGRTYKCGLSRACESIFSQRSDGGEDDMYIYLDPLRRGISDGSVPRGPGVRREPVREVIAFVVGQGGYLELQNLMTTVKESGSGRSVTYGCTDVVNAEDMMDVLGSV